MTGNRSATTCALTLVRRLAISASCRRRRLTASARSRLRASVSSLVRSLLSFVIISERLPDLYAKQQILPDITDRKRGQAPDFLFRIAVVEQFFDQRVY